jgi:phosphonate transport system substrate-binding protein
MLMLASYLAENTRPTYERVATWLTARLGEPASLLGGVAWEERVAMLDAGRVHAAFICGWSYIQRHDRPERPVDLLCAPVMAPPRYEDRPIYFTDVVVRHDSPLWSFADLRGQSYAYNDRGSHSGYNVPRDHLLRLGETRGYFGRVVASGSHQASIRMVAFTLLRPDDSLPIENGAPGRRGAAAAVGRASLDGDPRLFGHGGEYPVTVAF